ncbi:hypothetical protein NCS55_00209200 [Fusarium keratoplasticum]|nr:hypothetical protein NCS55_00209200 [Fusarium keratoplasticum]
MNDLITNVFFILAMLVGVARGVDLEDFVNNLNTDVAPAIRVGGPTLLKAIVGRARENMAVSELELMSSTSEEVWSIGQYICLFREGLDNSEAATEDFGVKFMTLREALQDGSLIRTKGPGVVDEMRRKLERICERFYRTFSLSSPEDDLELGNLSNPRPLVPDTRPTLTVIHDIEPEAPNIALNLQDTYKRTRIVMAAFLGALVQMAAVGVFVYVDKDPKFQLKNDKPIPSYALPTAITGTACMAFGIFLCAHVVEKSTTEASYRAGDKFEMCVYWVQRGQTVNDQVFEPSVLSHDKTCSIISQSRRNKANGTVLSFKTVVGVLFGISGTIIQFVGLRGMHSVASLAQLIAIVVMTAIRCIARTGLTSSFRTVKPRVGYELDWLAKKLVVTPRITTESPLMSPWIITMTRGARHQALEPLTPEVNHLLPVSEAQSILATRRGLSKLTQIPHESSQKAVNLATALGEALNILFPKGPGVGGARGFRWFLTARIHGQSDNQLVWIDLPFKEGRWSLEVDDLVAVLSLWTSVNPSEDEMSAEQMWEYIAPTEDRREAGTELYIPEAYGDERPVIQDMKTWAPQDHETLEAIREVSEGWGKVNRSSFFTGRHGSRIDECATNLLFSFVWSMAMTLEDPLLGKTEARRNATSNSDEERPLLWNSHLARLAKAFAKVSVRSEQATMLEIIWALSVAGKLPFPQPLFTSMSAMIVKGRRLGDVNLWLTKATREARFLIETYANGTSGISECSAAWLLDLLHSMQDTSNKFGQSYGPAPDNKQSWDVFLWGLIEKYTTADFRGSMKELYSRQGRGISYLFCETASGRLLAHLNVTPLHRRAMIRDMTGVGVPPEQNAFVNVQDVCNWTPLHYAAANRNVEVVKHLLNQHADIGLKDHSGLTAAHHACLSGCWETLGMLLKEGAGLKDQANNGASLMHLAAGNGHLHIVRELLQKEAQGQARNSAVGELSPTLSTLRDFDGRMPVHWAAAEEQNHVMEELKANINVQDYYGWTPLHIAVLTGRENLVEILRILPVNVEIKDVKGRTPLILACRRTDWVANEAIKSLVANGAKVDPVDLKGRTALHHLASRGAFTDIASILIKSMDMMSSRCLLNQPDKAGFTPLRLAVSNGHTDFVEQFLEAGADTHDIHHLTLLASGLNGANTDDEAYRLTKTLLRHGCSLRPRSRDGERPIDIARRRNFARVASYLEERQEEEEKAGKSWRNWLLM